MFMDWQSGDNIDRGRKLEGRSDMGGDKEGVRLGDWKSVGTTLGLSDDDAPDVCPVTTDGGGTLTS